jgi:hypothetical protein
MPASFMLEYKKDKEIIGNNNLGRWRFKMIVFNNE